MFCFFRRCCCCVHCVQREEVAGRVGFAAGGGLFANVWETIAASSPGLVLLIHLHLFHSDAAQCRTPKCHNDFKRRHRRIAEGFFFSSKMDCSSSEIDLSRCILGFHTQQIIILQSVCLLPLVALGDDIKLAQCACAVSTLQPCRSWFCAGLK